MEASLRQGWSRGWLACQPAQAREEGLILVPVHASLGTRHTCRHRQSLGVQGPLCWEVSVPPPSPNNNMEAGLQQ